MPNRSIYIRVEDLDLWEALEDKAEKVSNLLNSQENISSPIKPVVPSGNAKEPFVRASKHPRDIEYAKMIEGASKLLEMPACCKLPNPCRHWTFDGVDNAWTNSLTGEVKETM